MIIGILDALRYWLTNKKGYDEVATEYELQQVGTHISHKIYELNRKKKIVDNHPNEAEGNIYKIIKK